MYKNYLFIFFIVSVLFLVYRNTERFDITVSKPKVWTYWENLGGDQTPPYIDLCIETIQKHSSKNFDVIVLNEKNIGYYLPKLREDINKLPISMKIDYIRFLLLFRYGGVWINADTILMDNPKFFYDKLDEVDFVGTGCTGKQCNNGYPRPSTSLMCSKNGTELIQNCIMSIEKMMNKAKNEDDYNFENIDIGKKVLWEELEKMINNQAYEYYHFDSSYTGNRDSSLREITFERLLQEKVNFINPKKLKCVFLYNNQLKEYNLQWFSEYEKNRILNSNLMIGKIFRQSLNQDFTNYIE